MKKRAKLKDIAEALNISITTVSRALNDKEDISPQTKKAVLEVAKMINYKPNTLAVSLRKKVANNIIGVILPSVNHYFFATILKGILSASHKEDYMIMVAESRQDADREREIIEHLADHRVAGIIYAPSRDIRGLQVMSMMEQLEMPFVIIDRRFDNIKTSFIHHDDYNGSFAAVSHLISQGYDRIAHISGDKTCNIATERKKGYLAAMAEYDRSISQDIIVSCLDASKEEGYNLGMELLQLNNRPDAVFCVTDHVAAGVYDAAKELGIDIPKELGIAGFSNSEISESLNPPLTTIKQNAMEMGSYSLQFIIQQIKSPKSLFQKTFSTKLIVRGSSVRLTA